MKRYNSFTLALTIPCFVFSMEESSTKTVFSWIPTIIKDIKEFVREKREKQELGGEGLRWDNPLAKKFNKAYEEGNLKSIQELHQKHNVSLDASISGMRPIEKALHYVHPDLLNFLIDEKKIFVTRDLIIKIGSIVPNTKKVRIENAPPLEKTEIITILISEKRINDYIAILNTLVKNGADINDTSYGRTGLDRYIVNSFKHLQQNDPIINEYIRLGTIITPKLIHDIFTDVISTYFVSGEIKNEDNDRIYYLAKKLFYPIIKPAQHSYNTACMHLFLLKNKKIHNLPKPIIFFIAATIQDEEMARCLGELDRTINKPLPILAQNIVKQYSCRDKIEEICSRTPSYNQSKIGQKLSRLFDLQCWHNDWNEFKSKRSNSSENNMFLEAFTK